MQQQQGVGFTGAYHSIVCYSLVSYIVWDLRRYSRVDFILARQSAFELFAAIESAVARTQPAKLNSFVLCWHCFSWLLAQRFGQPTDRPTLYAMHLVNRLRRPATTHIRV